MNYRYLCYAFYFTMKKRITGYNRLDEALNYIGACRMCQTPYLCIDTKLNKVIDVAYFDMPKKELIRQFEEKDSL